MTLQHRDVWLIEVKVKERRNIVTFQCCDVAKFPLFLHQNYKKHGIPNFGDIERRTDEERKTKQEQPDISKILVFLYFSSQNH